ncbi:MAG: transposase, partial [Actinomycetota bacterium]|nr:transposase [Actinomycetota bacterium]
SSASTRRSRSSCANNPALRRSPGSRHSQTLKKFLRKQPRAATVAELQAQVDRFVCYFNDVRPHRAKGRKPPKSAFDSRDKAKPITREGSFTRELRVRHDRIDQHGRVTIRLKSRLHHIGMGRGLKGAHIILLVAGRNIRIITADGQLLRDFELDPSRDYQPQSRG